MTFEEWKAAFEAELMRRAGLTWADACGDPEPLQSYFDDKTTPVDAVVHFIEKYDLIDMTVEPWVYGKR